MIDFSQFRLTDWFEESAMKEWARKTLPGIPCPPLSSAERARQTDALKRKESRLITLLDETNLLLREMTKECAVLSPIRLLPATLVAPILKECMSLPNLNPTTNWQNGPILSITSLWRSEALNNAYCWSAINVTFVDDSGQSGSRLALESGLRNMEKMSRLKRQLEMSRAVSTHISVGFDQFMTAPLVAAIGNMFAAEFENCVSFRELVDHNTLVRGHFGQPSSLLNTIHFYNNNAFRSLRYLQIRGSVTNSTPMMFPALHTLRITCDFPTECLGALHLFNCPVMDMLLLDLNCDDLHNNLLSMFCVVSRYPKLRKFRLLLYWIRQNWDELDKDPTGPETEFDRRMSLENLRDNSIAKSGMSELVLAGPAFRYVETLFYLKHFIKMGTCLTDLTLGDTDFMRIIAITPLAMQSDITTIRFLRPPGQERYFSSDALVYQFLSHFPRLESVVMFRSREEAVDDRNAYLMYPELPNYTPDCTNLIRGILGHHSGSPNMSMRQFDIADWSLDVELLLHVEEEAARSGMVLPPVRFTTEAAKFSHSNAPGIEMQGQDLLPDITNLTLHDACVIWRDWLKDFGRCGSRCELHQDFNVGHKLMLSVT